jgi:internalin A
MSELAIRIITLNKYRHEHGENASLLDLTKCNLTKIPKEIGDLIWLEELWLGNEGADWEKQQILDSTNPGEDNQITGLPIEIRNLKNLKRLIIRKCKSFRDFSNASYLNSLQYIDIAESSVSDISSIKNLEKLLYLNCNDCKLGDLYPIENIVSLEQLYCAGNSEIKDILPLAKFYKLRILNIGGTSVSDLSPLMNFVSLSTLNFDNTNVVDISPLSQLLNLREISFAKTKIDSLQEVNWGVLKNIERLNISNTKVESLLPIKPLIKRGVLVTKKWWESGVCIGDCPLTTPPLEIIEQGNKAILSFFEEIKRAKKNKKSFQIYEAKCLIIGDSGAGKTSLAVKLLHPDYTLPNEKDITKGMVIYIHYIKLFERADFRLNIWDFGGQEIFHSTHKFFLTKRSLYILLDDTRNDDMTVNDPSFNYWLQVAQLYGDNSPLLIVQNEKGDRSKQLDLRGMQGRFGFVKDAKATNLLTCRGLDGVWQAIEYWLKQLPHIGEEQPKAWLDIRRELERLAREEGRDQIPLEEYYRICTLHDIPERKRALFLSSYLHDFGAFLHFQDHPLLRKMLVLNNQWATDGVYRVLDCEDVKQKFGRFNRRDLTRIWADDRYANQHDELLALMEKFELCYKLPDEREDTWLAPQLLSVLQPDSLAWEDNDNLQIRYEYEFMPKGLLSQHIVRMHRYIKQTELAWKSGVVFERVGAQALVTEAWGSRNIRIRARGANAKELLTLLSEDFDKMHERLEGLKVRKMIPCNCRVCVKAAEPHFYDHEKLLRRRSDGKRTVECDLSYVDVSVVGLLDGVFAKQINNPRHLIEEGHLEEGLQLLPDSIDKSQLLSRLINAELDISQGKISAEEYGLVKSQVSAAAIRLAK